MLPGLLGARYAVALLVALNQVLPLLGTNGLLPVGLAGPVAPLSPPARMENYWAGNADDTAQALAKYLGRK